MKNLDQKLVTIASSYDKRAYPHPPREMYDLSEALSKLLLVYLYTVFDPSNHLQSILHSTKRVLLMKTIDSTRNIIPQQTKKTRVQLTKVCDNDFCATSTIHS